MANLNKLSHGPNPVPATTASPRILSSSHFTMSEDLKNASEDLRSALGRYLVVCSNIRACHGKNRLSDSSSRKLNDQIQKEVDCFYQYESQLQDVKHALRVTRNSVRSITPISALPPDTLVHIFHLIHYFRTCTVKYLAQVCSQWRSVCLSCCSLWTQINYHPRGDVMLQPRLLNQVKTYLYRAGQRPLRISIRMGDFPDEWYNSKTRILFKSCAARMQALELEVLPLQQDEPTIRLKDIQLKFLETLLSNSTPGVLTELVTVIPHSSRRGPRHHSHTQRFLDLTTKRANVLIEYVSVLDLHGLFLSWKSTVYHNLVDLRLAPELDSPHVITEARLVSILVMSPHLRTFHFGMKLARSPTETSVESNSQVPVNLVDLETLRIFCHSHDLYNAHDKAERLLPLLAPGKKPLRVFLEGGSIAVFAKPITVEQTRAFFERSNVIELHARHHLLPLKLLSSAIMRNLELLVLEDCVARSFPWPVEDISPVLSSRPFIQTLQMNQCTIPLAELQSSLQRFRVEQLLLCQNTFALDSEPASEERIRADLSAVCANIVFGNTPE
ncbi:F-box-like domain protein [Rhizoctonia solani AG-3 Rhs1AP]|uniref:F-box-like domain protein n=2 Tax=Rhizoctonia solani AG-3 TaxID=1086053 RepID=A0A074RYB0_9AGAM|nr:F-box-like domain protein [Rhizoctonia solani AG-3 Rhs1AP]KEP49613.1 F-box-like domain protein [Rhizoctonia solani 123E]